jgi:hypothetical protein
MPITKVRFQRTVPCGAVSDTVQEHWQDIADAVADVFTAKLG